MKESRLPRAAEGGGVIAEVFAHRDRGGEKEQRVDAEGMEAAHLPRGDGLDFGVGQIIVLEQGGQFVAATLNDFAAAAQVAHEFVELIQAHRLTCFALSQQ